MTLVGQFVPIVLQGIFVTVVGWLVYNAGKHGFWMSGSPQTKEIAQVTVVVFLLVTGFLSSGILRVFQDVASGFTDLQLIGITLIVSRFVVNEMVDNWNHGDEKSLVVHGFGFLLILLPTL